MVLAFFPSSETGIAKEADLAEALPVGSEVDVVVLEVDETGRRIRLSVKAIADAQEAAEVREYSEREQSAAQSEGFGSLADKLRGALRAALEHPVGVRRLLGDFLREVPHFRDAIAVEAKDVDDRESALVWRVADVREHRHQWAFLEREFHLQPLLRKLSSVGIHRVDQHLRCGIEVGVVMREAGAGIFLVCLSRAPGRCKLKE